jgi:hypothetical protein
MSDPTAELQFENATYEQAPTGVVCGTCKKPVGQEYWQWIGRVTCATCRQGVFALEEQANSPATFARAALLGTGTALVCGIAYAVFVGFAHSQWALVTIGIAYVIASVIRKATKNVSGRRYQILAVVLTYFAGAMGNAHYFLHDVTPSFMALTYLIAMPILRVREDPLQLVIIGIGLVSAWQRTRGLSMVMTGPYLVTTTTTPARPALSPSP